ncbi:MAG: hypothetical protein GX811_10385, partial [Lentisphaerae bacterium]|nr:hypothetical protein [Lentisphaerota bacterium]
MQVTESIAIKRPTATRVKRPMVGFAISVITGTWLGLNLTCQPIPLAVLGLICALASLFITLVFRNVRGKKEGFRFFLTAILIHLSIILLSIAYSAKTVTIDPNFSLSAKMDKPRESLDVIGIVCSQPVTSTSVNRITHKFQLKLKYIHRLETREPASETLTVFLSEYTRDDERYSAPNLGEEWELSGVLRDNSRDVFSGARLPLSYWAREQYVFTSRINEAHKLEDAKGYRFLRAVFSVRNFLSQLPDKGLENRPDVSGVLKAILLGHRTELPDDTTENMQKTGTFHVMAISGLHVGIVATLIVFLIRIFGAPKKTWFPILFPLIIFYVALTGMRPSATRAGVMAIAFFAGHFFDRKPDTPTALSGSAILILAYNPRQLLDIGFIMSFSIVAMLLILCPVITNLLTRNMEPNYTLEATKGFKLYVTKLKTAFINLVVVSSSAWIASAPLTAYYFNQINPSGLIANLIVVPIVFAVVFLGLLSLLLGSIHPVLCIPFNKLQIPLVGIITKSTAVASIMPGGFINVKSPPIWVVVAWFTAIWTLVLLQKHKKRIAFPLIGIVCLYIICSFVQERHLFIVDIIPTGKTGVALVQSPTGNYLIDTGNRNSGRRLVYHLKKQGVNSLSKLVVTRGDFSSIGGFESIPAFVQIKNVTHFTDYPPNSSGDRMLSFAKANKINAENLSMYPSGKFSKEVKWLIADNSQGKLSRWPILIINRNDVRLVYAGSVPDTFFSDLKSNLLRENPDILVVQDAGIVTHPKPS